MRTHAEILKDAGPEKISAACGNPSNHTIRSWFQRGRVPHERWKDFADADLASLEELAAAVAASKAAA